MGNGYEILKVATKYRVEDVADACTIGSRLFNILERLESGNPVPRDEQEFLFSNGLLALAGYGVKNLSFTDFRKLSLDEQVERQASFREKARQFRARIEEERERAEAAQRAFDNDPVNIAKVKELELRKKYGLCRVNDQTDFPALMDILRKVDRGSRLSEDEVVWLHKYGDRNYKCYFTRELSVGFHRNEAAFHAAEFKKKKDPWSAVNASTHYRKCGDAITAESILGTIDVSRCKNPKLQSALCTTHGGVKRDLKKLEEALVLGERAHSLTPRDFRPCTLLGAVNMEIGRHDLGRVWYDKAVERGFTEEAVDKELRSIFNHLEKSKQGDLREFLLGIDPVRYSWAKKK